MSSHADGRELVQLGRRVLEQEAGAVAALAGRLDDRFAAAVRLLVACRGRVVVSGVGKSGVIARKIAATLTSTGTPATFLHAVDSVHGDLGIVGRDDAAILISKSGETDEMFGLVGFLKRLGVKIVAITGNAESTLAKHADVALDAAVSSEACPLDLAPTTSTTVALALGDALAIALFEAKGFKPDDFARLHPGGALGRRLLLLVRDVMVTEKLPAIGPDASMRECVLLLAERRGTVAVVGPQGVVIGVVTAGDLTRLMEKRADFLEVPVRDVMTRTPKLTRPGELASSAVNVLEKHGIMAMPVVDDHDHLVGVVHLHDLMRAGAA
ncbi:MAG TPA: KpsF/GutQ family sugar-phosphate isomerase [Gemmatimonadales bacterium]|nr:KpsF/GutQ family sugar-phosphate isomerase [Gemmatimonadales bacterium]